MKNNIVIKALKNTTGYIIIIPLFSMIITYLTLQLPMYIKYAIDGIALGNISVVPNYIKNFFNDNVIYNLSIIVIYLILTNILLVSISYARKIVGTNFNLKVNKNLKMEIFRHIQNLEYQSYNNYDKDEMMQRIKDDATTYSNFFNTSLNLILDTFFIVIFMINQSIQISKPITIYILISVIILILFAIWYFEKIDNKIEKMIRSKKKLLSKMISAINNFKITRIFNRQEDEIKEYNNLNESYTKSRISFINLVLFHEIITDHISYLSSPIIYIIGGILVIKGELTLGSLTVLINFAVKVMSYFILWGNNLDEINEFITVNKLLNELMYLKEENTDYESADLCGDIIFLNVSIEIDKKTILKNINIKIKRGEKLAVVGENGAGKSVLVKALLGFYNYTGSIYINNINIKKLKKSDIRKHIGLVIEDTFIFSGTIYDNICLNNNIEINELNKITKKANIYEDIQNFADKYNCKVGEKGITLSGGQKQRIAIARELIQNKEVLILDEAINKMDETTKAKVFKNVILDSDKTIIMITHDLNILNKMDKVMFLHNGTSHVGTHKELMKNKDYKNMIEINEDII